MAAIELLLFVGPDGPKKRRIQLKSESIRLICIKAEDLMRQFHSEGRIAWICLPPIIPRLSADQQKAIAERVKSYLTSVMLDLDAEPIISRHVNGPEGPVRSAV